MRSPGRMLALGYAATIALFTYALLEREPYDDAYFFKRIALNFLDHGRLAWNVDEGPSYGLTSQAFELLAVLVTLLTRNYYVLAVRGLLVACLVAAYVLLLRCTARADRGMSATYAFCSPVILYTALSGMETAFALLLIALFLWVLYARGASWHWAVAPGLVLLVYVTRPDAALLITPILLFERFRETRRIPLREILLLGAGLGLILLAFRLGYGTALPLPFYAKSATFSPYDAHFKDVSRAVRSLRFGLFLASALPLLLLGAMKRDATNRILLGSAALYAIYHYTSTIEVMGMQGRFYAPALPVLIVAASRGLTRQGTEKDRWTSALLASGFVGACALLWGVHWLPRRQDWFMDQVSTGLYIAAGASALLAFAAFADARSLLRDGMAWCTLALTSAGLLFSYSMRAPGQLDDDAYLTRHAHHVTTYLGMTPLRACLGDRIHVYHSEIGVTGLRFQNGTVSDLVGLMSPRWLFRTESFDAVCSAERPEAIFLPHRNYRVLNQEITSSGCLQHYVRVVQDSSSPLFVRKDLFQKYAGCARGLAER
jgi:hypothetical protein